MSIVNLSDAKIKYEGQSLPAINLISKLQTQLNEAVSRLDAISSALGELQAALLNSHTVEVKLTLTKEDYGRFTTLKGRDDSERIRNAVMKVIHPSETEPVTKTSELVQENVNGEKKPPIILFETHPETTEEKIINLATEQKPDVKNQTIITEHAIKPKTMTKCPRCQSLIEIPDVSNRQWPLEVQCSNCGSKCLIKSKTLGKTENTGFEPVDINAYGMLFNTLTT